jgi:hypothetical protein
VVFDEVYTGYVYNDLYVAEIAVNFPENDPDQTKRLDAQRPPKQLAGRLKGFMGFFARAYRHHDFMLGRRNMESLLRRRFVLPEGNTLFQGGRWTDAQKAMWRVQVDGAVGVWSGWSQCAAAAGRKDRARHIVTPPSSDGRACPALGDATDCAVACVLGAWAPWGECSASCGGGHAANASAMFVSRMARTLRRLLATSVACFAAASSTACAFAAAVKERAIIGEPSGELARGRRDERVLLGEPRVGRCGDLLHEG